MDYFEEYEQLKTTPISFSTRQICPHISRIYWSLLLSPFNKSTPDDYLIPGNIIIDKVHRNYRKFILRQLIKCLCCKKDLKFVTACVRRALPHVPDYAREAFSYKHRMNEGLGDPWELKTCLSELLQTRSLLTNQYCKSIYNFCNGYYGYSFLSMACISDNEFMMQLKAFRHYCIYHSLPLDF